MKLLHFSPKPIERVRAAEQTNNFPPKPDGFWYSCGDDWENWAKAEGYKIPKKYIYQIEVDYSKILTIRSEKELKDFVRNFGMNSGSKIPKYALTPDWKKVASQYSGIEICPYIHSMRLEMSWYYPWDVASGCIWDPSAIKSLKLVGGTMTKKENLNEGLVDLIKKAVASAKQGVSQGWEKVQGALRSAVANLSGIIQKKAPELAKLKPQLQFIVDIKNEAEKETGEKFPIDNTMQIAQNLTNKVKEASQEINGLKAQVSNVVNQGQQVPQNQRGVQEAFAIQLTGILNETIAEYSADKASQPLNEALGVTTVVGLVLGIMGGIPLLLKGLYKFSKFLGLEKTSHAIEHAYHVAHKIEEKGIDIIIPDRLSYVIYKKAWAKGFKTSKTFLEFADYSQNKQHAKQKVESLIYKLLLVYFAAEGISGLLHSTSAALATAEGAASTVKAVEIATGIVDAVSIVKKA